MLCPMKSWGCSQQPWQGLGGTQPVLSLVPKLHGSVQEQAAVQGAREEQCCVSPQLTQLKALGLSSFHHQAGSFSPAFPGQPPSALPRSSMGKGSCTQGQLRVNLSPHTGPGCLHTVFCAAYSLLFPMRILLSTEAGWIRLSVACEVEHTCLQLQSPKAGISPLGHWSP